MQKPTLQQKLFVGEGGSADEEVVRALCQFIRSSKFIFRDDS
jgi:hypothetical protein